MLASAKSNVVCSWTNGRKANVYLVEQECGRRVIRKCYSPRFLITMFREYFVTLYLSRRVDIIPQVLAFNPFSRELLFSYMQGERVLEWVLARYGDGDLRLEDFSSFHGLSTNSIVAQAFQRFRSSQATEANRLKQAITESYELLHKTGFVHGSADPRNLIYDGEQVFIIDFDHSRPSLNPRKIEYRSLQKWYGVTF